MKSKHNTIWITGAAGFSARHLAANLRRSEPGSRLIGLGRNRADRGDLDDYYPIDITDLVELKKLAESEPPHLVYHLAAAIPPVSDEVLWHVNVGGIRILIEAVAGGTSDRPRVLVTSTAAVYRPTPAKVDENAPAGGANAYGCSKWAQEQVALASGREYGADILIARTFNLIGPGLPPRLLAGALCAKLREPGNLPIPLGDLSSFRDFIDVRDAVEAYRLIVVKGRNSQIFNVCSGRATRVRTLVNRLATLAGKSGMIQERILPHSGGVDRSHGDPGALLKLGWKPTIPIQRTLRDMLDQSRVGAL